MKFDIVQRPSPEGSGEEFGRLSIDGHVIEDSYASHWKDESGIRATVYEWDDAKLLFNATVEGLSASFTTLKLPFESEWLEGLDGVEISFEDGSAFLQFVPQFSWEDWAKPYSIARLAKAVKVELSKGLDGLNYIQEDEESVLNGFGVQCRIVETQKSLRECLEVQATRIKSLWQTAEESLLLEEGEHSLVTLFRFPSHIQSACEQYLIYFVQFLQDLGIEASAEIRQEADKVLFSVTPSNHSEALGRIKEALDIYLAMPGHAVPDMTPAGSDIAVQQLESNILFLSSQLRLARATMQVQDATIETLQLNNYQYRQLLSSVNTDGAGDLDKDTESLAGGIVTIKPYDVKGLTINLPELYRRLKRRLSR